MKLTFLGTSCMVPTKDRSHAAAFLELEPYGILIDCGEGTQRQFKFADIRPTRITHILISHWHGDHVLGLPGLLQTLSSMFKAKTIMEKPNPKLEDTSLESQKPIIKLVGPKGTKKQIEYMKKAFLFEPDFDLKIIEAENNNNIIKNDVFSLSTFKLDHGIPTIGFRLVTNDKIHIDSEKLKKLKYNLKIKEGPWLRELSKNKSISVKNENDEMVIINPDDLIYVEEGKIIGLISDTLMCPACSNIANDADLLVCEAAYHSDLEEKAIEFKHLTSAQTAQLASSMNVNKLIINHFSQRYKSSDELLSEARSIFPNTDAAFDLMKINID